MNLDNRELLVGDVLSLTCFCLYKQVSTPVPTCRGKPGAHLLAHTQITALIMMPSFPGWLAPLNFSLLRFEEFLSFLLTGKQMLGMLPSVLLHLLCWLPSTPD